MHVKLIDPKPPNWPSPLIDEQQERHQIQRVSYCHYTGASSLRPRSSVRCQFSRSPVLEEASGNISCCHCAGSWRSSISFQDSGASKSPSRETRDARALKMRVARGECNFGCRRLSLLLAAKTESGWLRKYSDSKQCTLPNCSHFAWRQSPSSHLCRSFSCSLSISLSFAPASAISLANTLSLSHSKRQASKKTKKQM